MKVQFDRLLDQVEEKLPDVYGHLELTGFPQDVWQQICSNKPNELLNRESRRRTEAVGIFPSGEWMTRLVGAVLAEQTDEWAEGRRVLCLEVLALCRMTLVPAGDDDEEVTAGLPLVLSAQPVSVELSRKKHHYVTTLDLTSERRVGRLRQIEPATPLGHIVRTRSAC